MKQELAKVIKNELISAEPHYSLGRLVAKSHLLWLNCPQIVLKAHPGQFVMVNCGADCILPRPFSIHRVNAEGEMALLFSVWEDGKGTNWLSQRKAGNKVELFGTLGNGFSIEPESHNLLLVAGGIGIAPLYFLAQEALKKKCSVMLLCGTKKTDLLYQLCDKNPLPPEIKLVIATEDGKMGEKGMVTDLLPEYVDWADQIFACGPLAMYRDMAGKYHQLKHKLVQVSLEMMMGCGVGACYGCTVKTINGLKQVCKDGPIFSLQDILWDELT